MWVRHREEGRLGVCPVDTADGLGESHRVGVEGARSGLKLAIPAAERRVSGRGGELDVLGEELVEGHPEIGRGH